MKTGKTMHHDTNGDAEEYGAWYVSPHGQPGRQVLSVAATPEAALAAVDTSQWAEGEAQECLSAQRLTPALAEQVRSAAGNPLAEVFGHELEDGRLGTDAEERAQWESRWD